METANGIFEQPFLVLNEDMEEVEFSKREYGSLAFFSHRSPLKQTCNEDSLAIFPISEHQILLIVADGLGGHLDGYKASSTIITTLQDCISNKPKGEQFTQQDIIDAIDSANATIKSWGTGAASTVAIAEINTRRVRTYHAGDSEILMSGLRGRIKLQTVSHSPVGYAFNEGVLDEHQAIQHEERHIIYNAVGFPDMYLAISRDKSMDKLDTLLIASDGVFDNLLKNEIINLITQKELFVAADELKQEIMLRMQDSSNRISKADDLSFILYRNN